MACARDAFASRLDKLLRHTPPGVMELRLGFSRAVHSLHYALGLLCPDGTTPGRQELPGGIERFWWADAGGPPVLAWNVPGGVDRDVMARLLFYDVPLSTDYAVCLEDGSDIEGGWWETLTPLLDQGIDYLGNPRWQDYTPVQMEHIQAHPYYLGVPFGRDGRPGVSFMAGGLLVAPSERLREANYPEPRPPGRDSLPPLLGAEVMLGEVAHQLGWVQAEYAPAVPRSM